MPNRNPNADVVVIKALIVNKLVHRIHVDLESSAKVMYWHCFTKLEEKTQKRLQLFSTPLVDFAS